VRFSWVNHKYAPDRGHLISASVCEGPNSRLNDADRKGLMHMPGENLIQEGDMHEFEVIQMLNAPELHHNR
jgi:hypothetical protein